jgi:Tol biopolymer transport system component
MTFGRRTNHAALAFSSDGTRLTYAEMPTGAVLTQSVDRTSPKQKVIEWAMPVSPSGWLPDGRALLLNERDASTGGNLLVASPDNDWSVTRLTPETTNQWGASPSADGRYLV